jgi:c-di-GMP-binding flagellar brake protein YcgR
MFQDTRPAELDASGEADPWAPFRVTHAPERLGLLRQLRDGSVPIMLNAPSGVVLSTTLWAVDAAQERINFSALDGEHQINEVVEANEVVAVAYLESVKLQFDLQGLVLVRGANTCALQARLPQDIYRFQRRNAYRVRPQSRNEPVARFGHPAIPEMQLALRVLDVSIGGCALWLPSDVPPLQAGTRIGEMRIELDSDTRFPASVVLQHVSMLGSAEHGVRLGCEWQKLPGASERALQRWIDQTQKRSRMLHLQ